MPQRLRFNLASAIRALAATPATSAFVVLTLAVSVGLNLAMFGLVDRALLSPPAHVSDPGRLFTVAFEREGENGERLRMTTTSFGAFNAMRDGVKAAASVAAWQRLSTGAVVDGVQLRTEAMLVSGSYFQTVGAAPRLGRAILPEDDRAPGGPGAAVLSHAFWMATFRGDPNVVGRRLTVRGMELTVAGVMPPGFSGHSASRVDVWIPFAAAMQQTPGWQADNFQNVTSVLMRLKPGEQPAAAAAQATAALEHRGRTVTLSPVFGAAVTPTEGRIAYWLTAVSLVVLVMGLANAATLLLVRGARRRRDLAIRAALGATRGRLVAQVTTEAALIAVSGTAAALALASWFDEVVRRVLLPSLVERAGVDARVFAAAAIAGAIAFAVAALIAVSQLPAYFRTQDLITASRNLPRRRVHGTLLVVQTTLSVLLLAGAGVFGRSLHNLVSQDFGMRMDGVVLVQFDGGPGGVPDEGELFASALERVRVLPGVERATVISAFPFSGFHVPPIGVPGHAGFPNVDGQLPFLNAATPEFLEILDIDVVRGRRFTDADERGAPVVIVNETMARTLWPEGALGKCIRIGFDPSFDPSTADGPPGPPVSVPCREVVGVARDVRQRSVLPDRNEQRLMQYFVPFSQIPPPPAGIPDGSHIRGLLLRTSTGPAAIAAPLRRLVTGDRTDLPFLQVRAYSDLLERQVQPWRLGATLFSIFGALALAVATMGLYAVFAYLVGERRHEMAVRIAIGARPSRVLAMILRESALLAAAGIVCGSAIAMAAGRWVQSMMFGTAPTDPIVLGGSALVMLTVAALATIVPARSAARTDPNVLLRAE